MILISVMIIAAVIPVNAEGNLTVSYAAHVQDIGTQSYVSEGSIAGTTGKNLRMEGLWINLNNQTGLSGTIQYRSHIQDIGWETNWHNSNEMSGTTGKSLQMEAIEIRLTGDLANNYDVYYRVHSENIGWMNWATDGNPAGTEGYGLRMEAVQVVIRAKNAGAPAADPANATEESYINVNNSWVEYSAHVQDKGTQGFVRDGATAGTTGENLRLEALRVRKGNRLNGFSGDIQYRSDIQNMGWESNWHNSNELSGTTGRALRLEAVEIRLTGDLANNFDIYYRAHVQNIGWMNWASNGNPAGTEGKQLQVEALQIVVTAKNAGAPAVNPGNATNDAYQNYKSWVEYAAHVQDIGTQNYVKDGALSGTTGLGKHMEGLKIRKGNQISGISGDIQYKSYVQNNGWESKWYANDQYSGTKGKNLQIEAVQIKLTGDLSKKYDIWYQVHVENIGWMGWTENGSSAGTTGYGYRIEGIHILLKNKNQSAPGSTDNSYLQTDSQGIDISEHNQNIDLSPYQKEFVIIRAGYGWAGDPSKVTADSYSQIDKQFVNNVKKCESLGIPYGIYWYSYATNEDEAKKEAETFYHVTKNYSPALGFWMDEEGDNWKYRHNSKYENKGNVTKVVNEFTSVMQKHGKRVGVYASYNWFQEYISTNLPKWVAHYGKVDNGNKNIDLSGYKNCVIHQYTSVPLDKDILQVPLAKIFN